MKNFSGGSIQNRNGNLSYVCSVVDARGRRRQRWVALKTKDMTVARARVREWFGALPADGEVLEWLHHLVRAGQAAQAELNRLDGAQGVAVVGWTDLLEVWRARAVELTDNAGTLRAYQGQVRALVAWATGQGIGSPAALSGAAAQEYVLTRAAAAQKRDAALFKRVWRDLELQQVWDKIRYQRVRSVPYRRLRVEEVAQLCRVLRDGGGSQEGARVAGDFIAQPDLLDLVLLGFYTALRRKDLQHLSVRSVDGDFLLVRAAKTAHHGGAKVLSVPLVARAREIVRRRVAGAGDDGWLFPRLVGGSLDKALRLSFKRAGVVDSEEGKASFHSLRATFISLMDDAGGSGHVTDAITGHKSGGMHGRYSQPSRAALMAAVVKALPVVEF